MRYEEKIMKSNISVVLFLHFVLLFYQQLQQLNKIIKFKEMVHTEEETTTQEARKSFFFCGQV